MQYNKATMLEFAWVKKMVEGATTSTNTNSTIAISRSMKSITCTMTVTMTHNMQWSGKHCWCKVHEAWESSGSQSDSCSCTSTSSDSDEERFTYPEAVDQLSFIIEPIQMQVDNVTHGTEVYVDLMTASDVKFKARVDIGAEANILPVCVYNKIVGTKSHLRPSTAHLQGYGGQILHNDGIAMIKCRISASDLIKVPFYITKEECTPTLGL